MRISDWSSDVCSSDLHHVHALGRRERACRSNHASHQARSTQKGTHRGARRMTQTTFVVDELLADARAANEGLTHFGDPDLRPALDKLCASLEHDARLSDMGRYLLRQTIVMQLGKRLRTEGYFEKHPEIEIGRAHV